MPPKIKQKQEKKRKKLRPPPELLDTVDEMGEGSDTVEGDIDARDISFTADVTDDSDDTTTRAVATHNRVTRHTQALHRNTSVLQAMVETQNNEPPPVNTDTSATSDTSPIVVSDEGAHGGHETSKNLATSVPAATTIVSTNDHTTKGAVARTTVAAATNKRLNSSSWYNEVERQHRESEREQNASQSSGRERGLFSADGPFASHIFSTRNAESAARAKQTKVGSIYDQPPKLIIDPQVRSIFGDSAYFKGGEYRKPDMRTIYIESLERMYQVSISPTFDRFAKEKVEYDIKSADKLFDKFLEMHNQMLNECDTEEEIERHRVIHRNTQRMHEVLLSRLLDRLGALNAEERDSHQQSRFARGRDNRDLRSVLDEVKFEKIRIPHFDGQFQKWPQFKRLFETYVHDTDISDGAKMVHLISHLKEGSEPRTLVSGLDPRGENYRLAWAKICDAYDDERQILDSMITSFLDIPSVQVPSRSALMNLVTRTRNLIEPMTSYGIDTESWGVWIVPILARKLDATSRSEWIMKRPRRVKPTIEPLLSFITNRAEGVEELPQTQNPFRTNSNWNGNRNNNHKKKSNATNGPQTANNNHGNNLKKRSKCPDPLCAPNNDHQLFNCPKFKSFEVKHRLEHVRALGVCEKCLRKGHNVASCTLKTPCRKCDEHHNTLLCESKRLSSAIATSSHMATNSAAAVANDSRSAPLLATAIIVVIDRLGQSHRLRALCDQGSQPNLITAAAYQIIGHGKTRSRHIISGIGGRHSSSVGEANITFQSRFESGDRFHMSALVMPTITGRLPLAELNASDWDHLKGLSLADPNFTVPDDIDVVLGAAMCAELVKPKIVRVSDISEEPSVDHLLTKFWELEEVPPIKVRSPDEKLCEEIFTTNTTRTDSGRYVVRIPMKPNAPLLGDSRNIAVRRLLQMEERFVKRPELKSQYIEFMAEYLQLGHMIVAPPLPKGAAHYYIPHHAAGTKKFRVVFDGSSKTSNGVAFNDLQPIGERLQPDLRTITMRFRTHKVALTADIKKMYRQVLVCTDQYDYQRIVWRENPRQPISDYQLITQTYGLRSAPHNCVRALVQCANDNELTHPLSAEVARRDFYIDDMLSGADSVDSAMALRDDLNTMLASGGFELAKWCTNSDELRERFECSGAGQLIAIDKDEADSSVLGLRWNPITDAFKYKIMLPNHSEKVTKRRIVSNVAKLYDPNGYLSPVVITAKVLIQDLWKSECSWDSKVPTELAQRYRQFVAELPHLEKISIPRWIGTSPQSFREIHAFCDASNIAYGCVFYVKTIDLIKGTTVRLVSSKTRVAPIKTLTIPRLELCGAHTLAKMLQEVREAHTIPPENCHLWTDSMIVLYWLNKCGSWKTYVANRIAETSELTKSSTWRHVPSNDNPADLASRRVSAGDIVQNRLWWEGPAWLSLPESQWPKTELNLSKEEKASVVIEKPTTPPVVMITREPEAFLENDKGDILQQSSCAPRLIRITAWILRFVHNARNASDRMNGALSAEEYVAAESRWVAHEQRQQFAEELRCKSDDGKLLVSKKSKLLGLKPFIKNGILRATGRLDNASLPYDAKHPIVMSPESKFMQLIIQQAHLATMHGGSQLTMHYIRQKYWVPALRRLTRKIIHRCVTCARHIASSMEQQMAPLPEVRVTPGRPFQKCGVDYCGPFYVKARGGRCKVITKAYVAVFVCLASRAVHLELVSELTSSAFLAALSRLASRRGRVHELFSDNGTTFHGADKDIAEAVSSWKRLPSNEMFQALYIKWTFIPPITPHQGGLWEAAVKSTKHHLRRVVGNHQLTFEEFSTVLAQVEACLNSRPITRITDDNSDCLALTPSHFWALEPVVTPMARDYVEVPTNRLQRWKLLQRFVQDFWRRWKDEYLDQLFSRTKWKTEQLNAAVDDIVLVRGENTPPTQWPIGRITAVYPGKDGLVRSVDVTCKGHSYRRSVTKLVRLPTDDIEK